MVSYIQGSGHAAGVVVPPTASNYSEIPNSWSLAQEPRLDDPMASVPSSPSYPGILDNWPRRRTGRPPARVNYPGIPDSSSPAPGRAAPAGRAETTGIVPPNL